jgi:hypothetical protein
LYKNITPDYYGFRDEDDGILLMKEAEKERELDELFLQKYRSEMQAKYSEGQVQLIVGSSSDMDNEE